MLARLARAFLVVALLLAQHTALAHQLDHVAGAPEQASTLCESHDLLGTVLGVASGSAAGHELLLLEATRASAPPATLSRERRLPSKSRGPPLIS